MPASKTAKEFINKLKTLSGHHTVTTFAKACGRPNQVPNFTNYLNGAAAPGNRVLKECLESLFGWQVHPFAEIVPLPKPRSKITDKPGVYSIYDQNYWLIYVGTAANLRTEISQTLNRPIPGLVGHKIKDRAKFYSAYIVQNKRVRENLEALLLRIVAHQTYNKDVELFR